ncbi:MAG: S49 family peptidase [Pseudobdellovibrionaceae bacterium]|nr:S49 family peptidase [Pseudobdellovibrionaceae bacterium]
MSFALSYIAESTWAITEEGLSTLISVASRQGDLQSLEKTLGRKASNAHSSYVRSGVGVIPVTGPTFKRANLFTEVSGATSYEIILRDLHALLENDSVKAILLNIDSPGGEANGAAELSEHIFAARDRKPIYAYVGGLGASAAYWIASSTSKVFASETALLGSIGVQTVVRSKDKSGDMSFVSSVSPNKNRDPSTEMGAREVQRTVDDLGAIFVQKVARNRGINPEAVIERFGQGSIFIGEKSLEKGMIDAITTFEGALLSIQEDIEKNSNSTASFSEGDIAKAAADARRLESERILGIQGLAKGRVSSEFTASLIADGVSVEQAALRILTKSDEDRGKRISDLKRADEALAGLSAKPMEPPEDSLDSDLRLAASAGLVSLA